MSRNNSDAEKAFLQTLFDAAVAASHPDQCMPRWLPPRPKGRVVVVGAGKAAASMARVLEREWGEGLEGCVIVPHGHEVKCNSIEVISAAHPVPDSAGRAAATRILDMMAGQSADDTVVCLISGGGSSLLCVPAEGISLEDKQRITSKLLASGAAIHEINCVRKKMSAIKGGKLAAAAAPAKVLTLVISDIPGNDAAMVASGPTLSDDNTPAEALFILDRYGIDVPDRIRTAIAANPPLSISDGQLRVLASSDDALLAAAQAITDSNFTPYSLGDLGGDAAALGREHAHLALQIADGRGPVVPPCVILSGGETTVTVRGSGRGGRNGEYALAMLATLNAHPSITAIACDTDGIDGSGDNAGVFVTPSSLHRASDRDLDLNKALSQNDSYDFFSALNDLIITGPTLTNTNDFRAIMVRELSTRR